MTTFTSTEQLTLYEHGISFVQIKTLFSGPGNN